MLFAVCTCAAADNDRRWPAHEIGDFRALLPNFLRFGAAQKCSGGNSARQRRTAKESDMQGSYGPPIAQIRTAEL
jgi:hypothetical protein